MKKSSLLLFLLSFQLNAEASLRPNYFQATARPEKFISEGVFIGGQPGTPASLLNVKVLHSRKKKKERIVLEFGDLEGKPLGRDANYFHVKVQEKPPRLVVDLANLQKTTIGPAELEKKMKFSRLVNFSDITMDPQDHSTNLTLSFKEAKSISVFMPKPGTLYIEMREVVE